jgi:hypothetical protein
MCLSYIGGIAGTQFKKGIKYVQIAEHEGHDIWLQQL